MYAPYIANLIYINSIEFVSLLVGQDNFVVVKKTPSVFDISVLACSMSCYPIVEILSTE